MKKIILLLFIFCSLTSHSQIWSVVAKRIAGKLTEKIITKGLSNESIYVLTASQKRIIASDLKNYGVNLPATTGINIFLHDGQLYHTNYSKSALQDYFRIKKTIDEIPTKDINDNISQDPNVEVPDKKVNPPKVDLKLPVDPSLVKMLAKSRSDIAKVARIQAMLMCMGYDIKLDGLYGKHTQNAIKGAFGIDCTGLTFNQVYDKIFLMFHYNSKSIIPDYQLIIKEKKTGKEIENAQLSETTLNERLGKLTCKPGEICLGLNKLSAGLSFSCTDEEGLEIEISISNKISVDISLDLPDGSSTKFSMDTNGKVKFTTSDHNGNIRGVSN